MLSKPSSKRPFSAPRQSDECNKTCEEQSGHEETEDEIVESIKMELESNKEPAIKARKVMRSLSNEEYEAIFEAVLNHESEQSCSDGDDCHDPGNPDDNDDGHDEDFNQLDLENMPGNIRNEVESLKTDLVMEKNRIQQTKKKTFEMAVKSEKTPKTFFSSKPKFDVRKKPSGFGVREHSSAGNEQSKKTTKINEPKQKMLERQIQETGSAAREHSSAGIEESKKNTKINELKQKMLERLIRETGTWVQCTKKTCMKWRYLHDVYDPAVLPEIWTCAMNDDEKHNSCDIPEVDYDKSVEDYVMARYTEGSIVWVKMTGFPWWPAMVEIDPNFASFFECRHFDKVASHYHVVFLDEKVSRAWVSASNIMPFTGKEGAKELGQSHSKKDCQYAKKRAEEALQMSIVERIKTYSFAYRYKGKWGGSPSAKVKKILHKKKRREKIEGQKKQKISASHTASSSSHKKPHKGSSSHKMPHTTSSSHKKPDNNLDVVTDMSDCESLFDDAEAIMKDAEEVLEEFFSNQQEDEDSDYSVSPIKKKKTIKEYQKSDNKEKSKPKKKKKTKKSEHKQRTLCAPTHFDPDIFSMDMNSESQEPPKKKTPAFSAKKGCSKPGELEIRKPVWLLENKESENDKNVDLNNNDKGNQPSSGENSSEAPAKTLQSESETMVNNPKTDSPYSHPLKSKLLSSSGNKQSTVPKKKAKFSAPITSQKLTKIPDTKVPDDKSCVGEIIMSSGAKIANSISKQSHSKSTGENVSSERTDVKNVGLGQRQSEELYDDSDLDLDVMDIGPAMKALESPKPNKNVLRSSRQSSQCQSQQSDSFDDLALEADDTNIALIGENTDYQKMDLEFDLSQSPGKKRKLQIKTPEEE